MVVSEVSTIGRALCSAARTTASSSGIVLGVDVDLIDEHDGVVDDDPHQRHQPEHREKTDIG